MLLEIHLGHVPPARRVLPDGLQACIVLRRLFWQSEQRREDAERGARGNLARRLLAGVGAVRDHDPVAQHRRHERVGRVLGRHRHELGHAAEHLRHILVEDVHRRLAVDRAVEERATTVGSALGRRRGGRALGVMVVRMAVPRLRRPTIR
eukprot:1048546-Prymnesium_polylepis.1